MLRARSEAGVWRPLGRLKGPCKKYGCQVFWPGPREPRRPSELPQGPPSGPPGLSRRPPGPITNQSKKPGNLKVLIKILFLVSPRGLPPPGPPDTGGLAPPEAPSRGVRGAATPRDRAGMGGSPAGETKMFSLVSSQPRGPSIRPRTYLKISSAFP